MLRTELNTGWQEQDIRKSRGKNGTGIIYTIFLQESILQESWGSDFGHFKIFLRIILRLDHSTILVSLLP